MKKSSCKWIKSNLCAYLDGELAADISSHIEKHLKICPSCQDFLLNLKNVGQFVGSLSRPGSSVTEMPRHISEEIKARLPKNELGIFTDPIMRNFIVAGLGVILIFFVAWFRFSRTPWHILPRELLVAQIEGGAKIKLPDKTTLFLKENSQYRIKSLTPQAIINLTKGEILVSVIKPHPLIIHTPHIKIQVGGTLFKVSVDKTITQVWVLEGKVMAGSFLLKQFEKAVCGKEILSLNLEPLVPEEIESLKQEFALVGLYDLYINKKPDVQKGAVLWREVK